VFFQAAAKMYNGSGEWGQMDELLRPYYEQDTTAGILTDEEADEAAQEGAAGLWRELDEVAQLGVLWRELDEVAQLGVLFQGGASGVR
jgi:pyruvate-formate lyase